MVPPVRLSFLSLAGPTLLQTSPDRTGIYVAVAVLAAFAALGVTLLLLSRRDAARGAYTAEALYALDSEGRLRALTPDGVTGGAHALGPDGLLRFVTLADPHADMRITRYVFEDGSDAAAERTPRDTLTARHLAAVEVTDSQGHFVLDADGFVRATPPLDGAVRKDLETVLRRVLVERP